MAEAVVRRAVEAFMAGDLDRCRAPRRTTTAVRL